MPSYKDTRFVGAGLTLSHIQEGNAGEKRISSIYKLKLTHFVEVSKDFLYYQYFGVILLYFSNAKIERNKGRVPKNFSLKY